jgi:hypothetical protein
LLVARLTLAELLFFFASSPGALRRELVTNSVFFEVREIFPSPRLSSGKGQKPSPVLDSAQEAC